MKMHGKQSGSSVALGLAKSHESSSYLKPSNRVYKYETNRMEWENQPKTRWNMTYILTMTYCRTWQTVFFQFFFLLAITYPVYFINDENTTFVDAHHNRCIIMIEEAHKAANRLLNLSMEKSRSVYNNRTHMVSRYEWPVVMHHFRINVASLPIEWQCPAKFQILSHQFTRRSRCWHPLILLK